MQTTEEEDGANARRHVTVVYHHMSYQQEEPTTCLSLYDHGNSKIEAMKFEVEDYLPFAILSVFIFMPVGILSLIHSLRVIRAVRIQDKASADYCSTWAIQHALTAYVTGSILTVVIFTTIFIGVYHGV